MQLSGERWEQGSEERVGRWREKREEKQRQRDRKRNNEQMKCVPVNCVTLSREGARTE